MRLPWAAQGLVLLASVLLTSGCADRAVRPQLAQQQSLVPPDTGALYTTPAGARLSSGALYQVAVMPEKWNGDIIVYVPGYHDPSRSPQLPGDFATSAISKLLLPLGYAYASTSFRGTGLIQPDWIEGDLLELVSTAKSTLTGVTGRHSRYVYMTGGSQGGLATVQAVERHPEVFSGGLAACGPIGDYARQIQYVGDFRVVFDEYFHDVIPGWPVWRQDASAPSPGAVDPTMWGAVDSAAAMAITDPRNADRMAQVLAVTHAPIDSRDPSTIPATALDILWYSFRGTNDAIAKLGSPSYSNVGRSYQGSSDDAALNAGVQRFDFAADPSRLAALQTQARLRRPLVTIHTTGDPVVPVWHEQLYARRLPFLSRLLFTPIKIQRYGHDNFTEAEILAGFAILVLRVSGADLVVPESILPDPSARTVFTSLAESYGARPVLISNVTPRSAAPARLSAASSAACGSRCRQPTRP